MNLGRLYLDYNATSPLSKSVSDWLKSGDLIFANPSSQHSDGKSARKLVNETKTQVFETFKQSDKTTNLFFHSGATEGIYSFAHSFAEHARLLGKDLLICFSKVDHPAVQALEERYFGSHVKYFHLERDKKLHYLHDENFETLQDKKDNNPDLIILYHHLWVHNETGFVSPLEELEKFKTIPDLFIHVDAVQAPAKIPEWNLLSCGDIWTFSAHKFGALKGIGFTLFSKNISFHPMIMGGGQQNNLRSGTENIHGLKSLSLALTDARKIDIKKTNDLRLDLVAFMNSELQGIGELILDQNMASNTIYFFLYKYTSDIALALFDLHGIEISAGSACSSGAARPSQVLLQMDHQQTAKNGLRLSLPLESDEELLNRVKQMISPVFNKLRDS